MSTKEDRELADRVGQDYQDGWMHIDVVNALSESDNDITENPSWALDHDLWKRAEKIVDPEGAGAKKYDDPWAVVGMLYKRLGGRIRK